MGEATTGGGNERGGRGGPRRRRIYRGMKLQKVVIFKTYKGLYGEIKRLVRSGSFPLADGRRVSIPSMALLLEVAFAHVLPLLDQEPTTTYEPEMAEEILGHAGWTGKVVAKQLNSRSQEIRVEEEAPEGVQEQAGERGSNSVDDRVVEAEEL